MRWVPLVVVVVMAGTSVADRGRRKVPPKQGPNVPGERELTAQLKSLLASKKLAVVPTARDCVVVSTTSSSATLACEADSCAGACRHVTTKLTVTTGKRWTVSNVQTRNIDDGFCGCCMLEL